MLVKVDRLCWLSAASRCLPHLPGQILQPSLSATFLCIQRRCAPNMLSTHLSLFHSWSDNSCCHGYSNRLANGQVLPIRCWAHQLKRCMPCLLS